MSWLDRLLGRRAAALRVAGEPASANGASSFHLWWDVPFGERLTEVAATLEVVEPPTVDRLYFWALQVSFVRPGGGGAHLGLQFHPAFPGRGAVNWGGYAAAGDEGELDGSSSALPSAQDNPNTRDFAWEAGRPYRLRIRRSPDEAPPGFNSWEGLVEDVRAGEITVVRNLYSRGEFLRGPVVWTEAFARCEHPSVAVRWSDLAAVGEEGRPLSVKRVSANYQERAAGGCDNTDATVDEFGWVQRTNVERRTRPGGLLELPRTV